LKIDLLAYKTNLAPLKAYRQANLNQSPSDIITNYAVSSYVPLIVCAYYFVRIEGATPELMAMIERIKQFYRYDEVVGLDELMRLEIK
jgi:hypothetical protein